MQYLALKRQYLETLASHGEFMLAQLFKAEHGDWVLSKRWPYSDIRDDGLKMKVLNVRTMTPDELLLDYEGQEATYLGMEKLGQDKVKYSIWETGSRGFHLNAYYPELANFSDAWRTSARSFLIRRYGADPAKTGGVLALEYAPHFKTGRHKVLQCSAQGVNRLSGDTRKSLEGLLQTAPKPIYGKNPALRDLYAKISPARLFGHLRGFRKVGKSYMMLCPFHPDKNASFAVPVGKPFFHCFGCGAKGDWVKYVMLKDGLSFREAKHRLEQIAKGD